MEARRLPGGTITLLFTDIEGSTQLVTRLGAGYGSVLADHYRLLRKAFAESGHEIETQGDALFVVFTRARDAVTAAADAQRAIAAHTWPDGVELKVRMGIHTSEPSVLADERYIGLGVHRAARICSAAHGGQVLLSNTTRELVEDDLPAGLSLRELGSHRLKDIERPERLTQLVVPETAADFPPLRTLGRAPASAPFAGREDELADATRRVVLPSGASRRRKLVVPALAATLAAAISIPVFALGRGDPELEESSTQPYRVTARIPVGNLPLAVAVGAGAVWVANGEDGTVSRIDPRKRTADDGVVPVGRGPTSVSIGEGALWVANSNDGSVTRIDPSRGSVVATIQVGNPGQFAYDVAAGAGGVWVVVFTIPEGRDMAVVRIEPESNRVVGTPVSIGAGNGGRLAVGNGFVWATNESANTVTRIDPRTGKVAGPPIAVGQRPQGLVLEGGSLWVLNGEGTVSRFDTSTLKPLGTPIPVGSKPTSIAAGAGSIWVVNAESLTVTRIDPKAHKVAGPPVPFTTRVAGEGAFADVGAGALWIANAADDEVVRVAGTP